MGAHTFGYSQDHAGINHSVVSNGHNGTVPTRPGHRGKLPWPRREGGSGRGSKKWKIAIAGLTIILLQIFGANVLFPLLTHHTIGSAQNLHHSSLGKSLPTSSSSSSSDSSNGGIFRLLSETASAWTSGDPGELTEEQAELLARYGDKNFRGQDIYIKRDGMTNPLFQPPESTAAAKDSGNVLRYKPRTLNSLYRDKCGNSTLLPYQGGDGREWVTTSRAWHKSFGAHVSKYRWCRGGANTEVPELKQVLMLFSNKPRPEGAVTVVTQLSLERASMLEQQCTLWPHPIAAVVYIPLVRGRIFSAEEGEWNLAPLERGIEVMKALHERLSALPDGCVLDMEVVAEECCNKDIGSMYPTNAVRNRALNLASTEVVILLDADFVVDVSLARSLEEPGRYEELVDLLSRHRAMVLPAFEAWDQGEWGKRVALEAVHKGKSYIAAKFMYNVVIGFHMSHYPQGHEKTNFWKWINTTEAYEVEYQIGFEPYIMMLKKFVPYYDERFRGYYWNKVQHLMHISMQDAFTFVVHPEAFVVHVPHRKPSTKIRTRRSGQKERNHVMFLEALEDMKNDRFVPVTGFPHLCYPPEMQLGIASTVTTDEQKAMLIKMAGAVKKVPSEELKGGGAEALAKARGQPAPQRKSPPPAKMVGGEVATDKVRPVIASAMEEQVKRKRADAEELRKDLQEIAEAEAAKRKKDSVPLEEAIVEESEAAASHAKETAELVDTIIAKVAKQSEVVEEEELEDDGNEFAAVDGVDPLMPKGAAGRGNASGMKGDAANLFPDEEVDPRDLPKPFQHTPNTRAHLNDPDFDTDVFETAGSDDTEEDTITSKSHAVARTQERPKRQAVLIDNEFQVDDE